MNTENATINNEILLHTQNTNYYDAEATFSNFIKKKRELENSHIGKKYLSTKELAERVDIDYEQFRKIINMNKPTKKRDCIIAICLALRLDSDETNMALQLYNYMPQLNSADLRDDLIINILEEQLEYPKTISEINDRLNLNSFPPLDIIDHRPATRINKKYSNTSFKIIKKKSRTYSDDLFYGDLYDSLSTSYDINRYKCIADMWLLDSKKNQYYKLTASTSGGYSLQINGPKKQFDLKYFKTIEETTVFRDYYIEIETMCKRELKKMRSTLNDTKNYKERIGADIFNGNLRVYTEIFNYTVPELNEYYLLEYSNHKYCLSVYSKSQFMYYYLGSAKYNQIFNTKANPSVVQYQSVADIDTLISTSTYNEINLLRYRKNVFHKLSTKVDKLVSDLQNRKVFICNIDYIYGNPYYVLRYFNLEKEFKCINNEYGDPVSCKVTQLDFQSSNGTSITLTFDDLCQGFELGLNNITEICDVKKQFGTIKNIIY